jgi:hypothetical protein
MTGRGTKAVGYKVVHLEKNVYSKDNKCFIICYPSQFSDSLVFHSQRTDTLQLEYTRFCDHF